MALISYYSQGTASVAANGTVVTGQGTQWLGAVKPGDQFRAGGLTERVLSVNSNTSLTLARGWPGAARNAAAYEVYVVPAPSEIVGTTRTLLTSLSSGVLSAFAGLTSAANKLPFFTGAGTMDVTDLSAKGREIIGAADVTAALETLGLDDAANIPNLPAAKIDSGEFDVARIPNLPAAKIPTNLDPTRAFRRGNILGAVSQSGGIPTGALIEYGSNSNGAYARWADGTMICSDINPTSSVASGVFGSIFISGLISKAFPATFAAVPIVAAASHFTTDSSVAFAMVRTPTTTGCNFHSISASAAGGTRVGYIAIGRWF